MDISFFLKTTLPLILKQLCEKFWNQPKIFISFDRGSQSAFNLDENTFVSFEKHFKHELTWTYTMHFRNNSKYDAYNIKLLFPNIDQNFELDKKIDHLEPIKSNDRLTFKATFKTKFKGSGMMIDQEIQKPAPYLRKKKFILEYTNVSKTKFYTIYEHSAPEDLKNKFQRHK
ncbi:hypothetical protein [Agriterribacter sp.]|uniref:hypothetical protein n=1 Tax=Agriterribacter sp. TaxID=2821509 RepID=UPI002C49965A|nr:hypothetical protein [Agriterribacter sp.]HRO45575.1 hypothetical protein [Agriterribacter sp.]HRQ17229.1 hypothetical protein [Agriterribacter sp.]